jgi:rSAM/selenodomain-associated transferase 1
MTTRAIRTAITRPKSSPSRSDGVALWIFAKAPIAGGVKSRLARGIGVIAAAMWYRRTLTKTIATANRSGVSSKIAAAPSAASFKRASPYHRRVCDQPMGDLGRRMAAVAKRSRGACMIVGSDIPELSPSLLRRSRRELARFDLILGPARDGGYYLIGFKSAAHAFRLFHAVRWSSPHALADTLANAPKHWRIGFLPMLRDVDCVEDLKHAEQPPFRLARA